MDWFRAAGAQNLCTPFPARILLTRRGPNRVVRPLTLLIGVVTCSLLPMNTVGFVIQITNFGYIFTFKKHKIKYFKIPMPTNFLAIYFGLYKFFKNLGINLKTWNVLKADAQLINLEASKPVKKFFKYLEKVSDFIFNFPRFFWTRSLHFRALLFSVI